VEPDLTIKFPASPLSVDSKLLVFVRQTVNRMFYYKFHRKLSVTILCVSIYNVIIEVWRFFVGEEFLGFCGQTFI
jgi:hypothetical protein